MLRTILLEPLLNALLGLYAIIPGGDFGVAVIALTIVIRILLWPLVKKQLHHQKAMRDLQPEIAKTKKKAKGDKQKESQLMLELFKEKEVNPFASIGLAFLQFPILIALFFVLREVVTGDIAVSTYGFIQALPAVQGIIANPEAFDPLLFGFFHMAEPSIFLALIAGGAQYIQGKQITPKATGDDPASKMGFNMVRIFPVITVVVASTFPSALALYWATSSGIAIFQQHLVLSEDLNFMQKLVRNGRNGKTAVAETPKEEKATPKKAPAKKSGSKRQQPKKAPAKAAAKNKPKTQAKNSSKTKTTPKAKPKGG